MVQAPVLVKMDEYGTIANCSSLANKTDVVELNATVIAVEAAWLSQPVSLNVTPWNVGLLDPRLTMRPKCPATGFLGSRNQAVSAFRSEKGHLQLWFCLSLAALAVIWAVVQNKLTSKYRRRRSTE